jgi:myosin-crossreactive antigen
MRIPFSNEGPSESENPILNKGEMLYVIGNGISGLASAVYLIRDGGLRGEQICIFEEGENYGGSLYAAGNVDVGYTMRGEQMFGKYFDCVYARPSRPLNS